MHVLPRLSRQLCMLRACVASSPPCDGEPGVAKALSILSKEGDRVLALLGVRNVDPNE
jgi:isopentenyl diphosphate isomerase/L-lactate dehydrogenase-like FMN-dependent dehydrogenase